MDCSFVNSYLKDLMDNSLMILYFLIFPASDLCPSTFWETSLSCKSFTVGFFPVLTFLISKSSFQLLKAWFCRVWGFYFMVIESYHSGDQCSLQFSSSCIVWISPITFLLVLSHSFRRYISDSYLWQTIKLFRKTVKLRGTIEETHAKLFNWKSPQCHYL